MCDTCRKIDPTYTNPLEDADETPTPSITVGTQVRLTGVVTRIPGDPDVEDPEFPETEYRVQIVGAVGPEGETGVWFRDATLKNLEVIRQSFKRGECVWGLSSGRVYDVLEDEEENGYALMVERKLHAVVFHGDVTAFERRPSRPKEER